jgi:drug/metabolite transporter (DMT)-like permease
MSLHQTSGRHRLGFLLATITMLIWGALPLVLKLLLSRLEPGTIVWARFTASTVGLGLVLAYRAQLPRLSSLTRRQWGLLFVATAALAANYLCFMLGLDRTTPATSQVLIQTGPLLLALGGLLVFREHFSRLQWLGFGVLVAGIATFYASQVASGPADPERFSAGVAFICVAALTWAINGLAQKQLLTALPSQSLLLCIYFGCALALAPTASPATVMELDLTGWVALGLAVMATLVAYGCFAASLAHVEASRVSAILALVPLATLAFATLADRVSPATFSADPVAPLGLAGAGAVICGSLITALGGDAPVSRDTERTPADAAS